MGATHGSIGSPYEPTAYPQPDSPPRQQLDQLELDQPVAQALELRLIELVFAQNLTVHPAVQKQVEVTEQGGVTRDRRFLLHAQHGDGAGAAVDHADELGDAHVHGFADLLQPANGKAPVGEDALDARLTQSDSARERPIGKPSGLDATLERIHELTCFFHRGCAPLRKCCQASRWVSCFDTSRREYCMKHLRA